jgi:hypothetical protein
MESAQPSSGAAPSLDAWASETEELLEAMRQRCAEAQARAEAARRDAEDSERSYHILLEIMTAYRQRVGSLATHATTRDEAPQPDRAPGAATTATPGEHRTIRQLILEHAKQHEGRLVLHDLVTELVEQGVFNERASATRNVTARLARLPRERCVRVGRGVYQIDTEAG